MKLSNDIRFNVSDQLLKCYSGPRSVGTQFDDLNGAIQGLLRLQDTYNLKTRDLANGIVEDININKQMDAKDCYDIGLAAYNEKVKIS
uniref:Prolyl 4-hydroxylase alpha-subunit N-terminal domain-containing protein n=1 Tax=Meloidogyne incognita TaxID=6306 RepID=A0A914L6K2_MELIC